MHFLLKNGITTKDRRLDRVYQRDLRTLNHLVRAEAPLTKSPRSFTYRLNQWLDQGQEGACVGFGFTHELSALPVAVLGLTPLWARQLYWAVQKIDPWPGGSYEGAQPVYEGTSVHSGAEMLRQLGYYTAYNWAVTLQELVIGLGYHGPAVLGLNWYQGMFEPDAEGFIAPTGQLMGGHCICAIGVKIVWKSWVSRLVSRTWENVDLDKSYVILHNSWGQDWGQNGRAKIRLRDLERLLNEQGDACFPVRNRNKRSA